MVQKNDQHISSPVHVDVDVVSVSKSKWATAVIRQIVSSDFQGLPRSSDSIPLVEVGDKVSVHPKYQLAHGTKGVRCGIIRNKNTMAFAEKWFAVHCSYSTKMPKSMKKSWCSWQDGEKALVLSLPSTVPGSLHDGINLACWKCGRKIIDSGEIFCIDKTCVWTCSVNAIRDSQLSVDKEKIWNGVKKCYVQRTRCSNCKSVLGSFYENRFVDCDIVEQEFPCFKIITAWERRKWQGNVPALATTLIGDEVTTQQSISNLHVSNDWDIEKDLLPGGRVDQTFHLIIEKAKLARQAWKEAEKCAIEAKIASQKALDIAAEKTLEAEAARRENEEAKAAVGKMHETDIIWECYVDGAWKRYPEAVSSDIETAYKRNKKIQFIIGSQRYEVDMSSPDTNLQQQRNLRTGFKRSLRRHEISRPLPYSVSHRREYIWECRLEGGWIPYPQSVSSILEQGWKEKSKRCFEINSTWYEIDFDCVELAQVNISSGTKRVVRRRDTIVPVVPSTWTNVTSGGKCELVPIVKGNDEWTIVEKELMRTIPSASLYSLHRVQNYGIWDYFLFQQARVGRLSANGDPNLTMVWHGTRGLDPVVICKDEADGFMMQFSNKGSWGQGLYFAQNASYSDGYAHTHQSRHGHSLKTLIYVNLIVGDEIQQTADSSLRLCPPKEDGRGRYHTVTGHANGSKIYIVYENGRGYPSYLVTYA